MAKKSSFHPTPRHVLALIPIAIGMAIMLRGFLDWNKNLSFLSHKNLSE